MFKNYFYKHTWVHPVLYVMDVFHGINFRILYPACISFVSITDFYCKQYNGNTTDSNDWTNQYKWLNVGLGPYFVV